jgi:hypothetical protein
MLLTNTLSLKVAGTAYVSLGIHNDLGNADTPRRSPFVHSLGQTTNADVC